MRASGLAFTLGIAFAGAASAPADAVLEVSGTVLSTTPRLEVRVEISNRGDRPAVPLTVTGGFFGQERIARLGAGVPPGGRGAVILEFDGEAAPAGVHALTLLLEHPVPGAPDAAGNPPLSSRPAWLLVALGTTADPAVRLQAKPTRIDVRGALEVQVESTDGRPHQVRLRAFTARGLRSSGELQLSVPARGAASTRVEVVRAGAARGTEHAVVLIAETTDSPSLRTTVLAGSVQVAADPSLLPRRRKALLAGGILLLAAAALAEILQRRRR